MTVIVPRNVSERNKVDCVKNVPKKLAGIVLNLSLLATGAAAQTAVNTSGGTTNSVPVFTGNSTIGNSAITQLNGNIGLGTTSPSSLLHLFSANWAKVNLETSGINSLARLGSDRNGLNSSTNALWTGSSWVNDDPTKSSFLYVQHLGNSEMEFRVSPPAASISWNYAMVIKDSGNVGIGTTTPGAKLEVNGGVILTNGSGASITFSDGTIQNTAWNGILGGGDYAESVDVLGDRKRYEPGDILVIDPKIEGKFIKSAGPYSTNVMGIYSTKPGLVGRRQTTPKSLDEVPMAMMGIVPAKVSAENGPVHPGDLLVTSSTPGYAMKGTDPSRMIGALIGKAMGSLESGTGVIEVAVTLH